MKTHEHRPHQLNKQPASAGTLAEKGRCRPSTQLLTPQIIGPIKKEKDRKEKVIWSWPGTCIQYTRLHYISVGPTDYRSPVSLLQPFPVSVGPTGYRSSVSLLQPISVSVDPTGYSRSSVSLLQPISVSIDPTGYNRSSVSLLQPVSVSIDPTGYNRSSVSLLQFPYFCRSQRLWIICVTYLAFPCFSRSYRLSTIRVTFVTFQPQRLTAA